MTRSAPASRFRIALPRFERKAPVVRETPLAAEAMADPGEFRLKIYTDDLKTPERRRRMRWLVASVLVFALFQGLVYAFLAPYLFGIFLVIPALLVGLVIWALPEAYNPPTRFMERCFFGFFLVIYLWPNYLAIALPGLPWITLIRLTDFPMVFAFAVSLSQSKAFRQELATIFGAAPLLWKLMLAFIFIMAITLPMSKVPTESIGTLFLACTNWLTPFAVAVFYFRKEGRIAKWIYCLCGILAVLGAMAIAEAHVRHILWAYSIPSFLKVEDPAVLGLLQGTGRRYTDIYRTQTTFESPLGFGEFVAITFPFVLHFIATENKQWIRLSAVAGALYLFYVALLSGSRSAVLGALISSMLTLGIWGFRRWRRRDGGLLGTTVVFFYPVLGFAVLVSTFVVGKIRNKVWGGGETASSSLARVEQWHLGVPLILKNPFGHGISMAAGVLQYRLPNGMLVIDSYFLRVLLDWGVMGFLVLFGMIFTAIGYAGRMVWRDDFKDPETIFVIPVAISLFSWFIVKGVNAEEGNNPFIFMLLGMMIAIMYRNSKAVRA